MREISEQHLRQEMGQAVMGLRVEVAGFGRRRVEGIPIAATFINVPISLFDSYTQNEEIRRIRSSTLESSTVELTELWILDFVETSATQFTSLAVVSLLVTVTTHHKNFACLGM